MYYHSHVDIKKEAHVAFVVIMEDIVVGEGREQVLVVCFDHQAYLQALCNCVEFAGSFIWESSPRPESAQSFGICRNRAGRPKHKI
jgi:hypothetical protein